MKCNLIFGTILSLSVVYASVSFRPIRSPQWQAPVRPYNGTNTWGGATTNTGGAPPPRYSPYNGTLNGMYTQRHPVPAYNPTGTFRATTPRAPHHLPGNRPYPTYNLTRQPGIYQPTYNQTRPSVSVGVQPYPSNQPRFGNQWNATQNTTSSRLYPDLSNRFGSGGAPNYGNNVNPAPVNPYPTYGGGGAYPNTNHTAYGGAYLQTKPTYGGGGGQPNTNPSYGGGIQSNTNPTYGGGGAYPNTNPSYGGGGAYPNTNPTYGGGGGGQPNTNPLYGGGIQSNTNPTYGGGGAYPNTNPTYGGGGVQSNTNPTYGNYNATRTNLPTFNPSARYNNTSNNFGGQQPNQGVNTWGHPNYQAPNASQQPSPSYYEPRMYS